MKFIIFIAIFSNSSASVLSLATRPYKTPFCSQERSFVKKNFMSDYVKEHHFEVAKQKVFLGFFQKYGRHK